MTVVRHRVKNLRKKQNKIQKTPIYTSRSTDNNVLKRTDTYDVRVKYLPVPPLPIGINRASQSMLKTLARFGRGKDTTEFGQ